MVVYFTGVGAFSGFLWAVYRFGSNYQLIQKQLYKTLKKERNRVDKNLEQERNRVNELKELIEKELFDHDSKLRQLVNNQLNPKAKEVDQAILNTAIKKASESGRSDIATRTIEFRREKWEPNPDIAARTIRIFKGLIEENPDDYDQTYAELAYAQKDKYNLGMEIDKNDQSLLEEAKLNLEKAISIRNKQEDMDIEQIDQYYIYYELNLAQCLIQLGEQDENKISQLLNTAAKSGVLDVNFLNRMRQDHFGQYLNPVIRKWILDHENFGSGKKYPEAIETWRSDTLAGDGNEG